MTTFIHLGLLNNKASRSTRSLGLLVSDQTISANELETLAAEFDFYDVLGIRRTASTQEIRTAYLGLAKSLHPDLGKTGVPGEEGFKKVNAAYSVLRDPRKRDQYDDALRFADDAPSGTGPGRHTSAFRREVALSVAVLISLSAGILSALLWFQGPDLGLMKSAGKTDPQQVTVAIAVQRRAEPAPAPVTIEKATPAEKRHTPAKDERTKKRPAAETQNRLAAVAPKGAPSIPQAKAVGSDQADKHLIADTKAETTQMPSEGEIGRAWKKVLPILNETSRDWEVMKQTLADAERKWEAMLKILAESKPENANQLWSEAEIQSFGKRARPILEDTKGDWVAMTETLSDAKRKWEAMLKILFESTHSWETTLQTLADIRRREEEAQRLLAASKDEQIAEVEKRLAAEANVKRLTGEAEKIRNQLDKVRERSNTPNPRIGELERQLNSTKTESAIKKEAAEEQRRRADALSEKIAKQNRKILDLESQLAKLPTSPKSQQFPRRTAPAAPPPVTNTPAQGSATLEQVDRALRGTRALAGISPDKLASLRRKLLNGKHISKAVQEVLGHRSPPIEFGLCKFLKAQCRAR